MLTPSAPCARTGIGLVPIESDVLFEETQDGFEMVGFMSDTPRPKSRVQMGTLYRILIGWFVTIFAGSFLTIVLYASLKPLVF